MAGGYGTSAAGAIPGPPGRGRRRGPRVPVVVGALGATVVLLVAAVAALAAQGRAGILTPRPAGESSGPAATRYVAPHGEDSGPGTAARPWRSLWRAARSVRPGEQVVFADGLYEETRPARFSVGGEPGRPIVVRAQHPRAAHIRYPAVMNTDRILVRQPHITIRDLELSAGGGAEPRSQATSSIVLAFREGGDHGRAIGNQIHGVFEDALKASQVSDFVARGNELSDTDHEGIDLVNVAGAVLESNVIQRVGRVGIVVKGGSRNVRILGNLVRADRGPDQPGIIAYALGGSTIVDSTYDVAGAEGYALLALNNIAVAATPTSLATAVLVAGCWRCAVHHTTAVGAQTALVLRSGGDPKGTRGRLAWNTDTRDLVVVNNLFSRCGSGALRVDSGVVGQLLIDHNLFHQCSAPPDQAHPVTGDPLLVDWRTNWHPRPGSPAIGAGTPLKPFPFHTDDKTPPVPPVALTADRDGTPRSTRWDAGAYQAS